MNECEKKTNRVTVCLGDTPFELLCNEAHAAHRMPGEYLRLLFETTMREKILAWARQCERDLSAATRSPSHLVQVPATDIFGKAFQDTVSGGEA